MLELLEDRSVPAALAPCDFASLGVFNPVTTGTYLIVEGPGAPTIVDPSSNVIFTGEYFNAGTNIDAVFDFDSFNLRAGITLTTFNHANQQTLTNVNTPDPVVFLSRTTMTIAGTIDFSGQSAYDLNALTFQANAVAVAGPGGSAGGIGNIQPFNVGMDIFGDNPVGDIGATYTPDATLLYFYSPGTDDGYAGLGPGGGGPNGNTLATPDKNTDGSWAGPGPGTRHSALGGGGAGGGGFGGAGAAGTSQVQPNFVGFGGVTDPGGVGGGTYGNLLTRLQGGSGGGGSQGTGGGGGGGAVELGAISGITITASGRVTVRGGNGAVGNTCASGGGSGGGILIHAARVTVNGTLDARGGNGGNGGSNPNVGSFADGGGGGGGRIRVIVATTNANYVHPGTVTVAGGTSGIADPGNPFGWAQFPFDVSLNPNLGFSGFFNAVGPIPPNSLGTGTPDPDTAGRTGNITVSNLPLPPVITPLTTSQVRIYLPVRWTYNAQTGLYSGYVTLINNGAVDFTGPFALVFTQLPRGVTVANSSVSTGGPICNGSMSGNIFGDATVPSGLTFLNVTGDLINPSRGGGPLRVFVQLRNPLHVNLGTFFTSFSYALQLYQGQFF